MPSNHFISKLSPDQWAEARRLRADGATYRDIAGRFGVPTATIKSRAGKEGWSKSGEAAPTVEGRRTVPARKPSPSTVENRQRLAQRLYKIIEIRMRKMELSMQKQLQDIEHDPDSTVSPAADPPGLTPWCNRKVCNDTSSPTALNARILRPELSTHAFLVLSLSKDGRRCRPGPGDALVVRQAHHEVFTHGSTATFMAALQ